MSDTHAQADALDAARLLLSRMGVSVEDLLAAPEARQQIPTFAAAQMNALFGEGRHPNADTSHHLQQAVRDPRNLNIALTGRYGTGKSSVLNEFESTNRNTTLRIAISTLGDITKEATLTNRIQKELVKQLLYRAAPGEVRFSRFNRIIPLGWRYALSSPASLPLSSVRSWRS